MDEKKPAWEEVKVTVRTLNEQGGELVIDDVPALRNTATGEVIYDPDVALRLPLERAAKKRGLEPRDAALLVVLNAPAYGMHAKHTPYHYTLNKMLFYQWRRLDSVGLGNAYPRDDFVADRKGPVPKHVKDDLKRLEKAGLIERHFPSGKEHQPVPIRLTKKGIEAAEDLQRSSDSWLLKMAQAVKTDLMLLSPDDLREKVHKEYPEYRRDYVEVDAS